ncbi:hypothetical protein ACFYR2_27665 [Streptomyces microflavus]|uniref:hypothetical protein n=1 Tax=Streptomyces microflavus TaxID=1919 RepID=UPI0036A97469
MIENPGAEIEIPDFPPPPRPGDLVLAAFKRRALKEGDWVRYQRDVDRWTEDYQRIQAAIESGFGVAPYWHRSLAEQAAQQGVRRRALGDPTAHLWLAHSRELEFAPEDNAT